MCRNRRCHAGSGFGSSFGLFFAGIARRPLTRSLTAFFPGPPEGVCRDIVINVTFGALCAQASASSLVGAEYQFASWRQEFRHFLSSSFSVLRPLGACYERVVTFGPAATSRPCLSFFASLFLFFGSAKRNGRGFVVLISAVPSPVGCKVAARAGIVRLSSPVNSRCTAARLTASRFSPKAALVCFIRCRNVLSRLHLDDRLMSLTSSVIGAQCWKPHPAGASPHRWRLTFARSANQFLFQHSNELGDISGLH